MPTETARYWRHGAVPGVDLLRATYVTHRYARHAHETYTVGVIESGVEEFDYGDRLASASLLTAALAGILSAHARLPGYAGRPRRARISAAAVAAVRDVLADRLADPPGLDELALAAGMSPFALLRAFRDETGLPPHAYLNQLRVRLARRLLDSGLPPADVAAEAGFADQPHLSRHFKRVVGVPPGAYQRERDAAAGARRGKNVQDSPPGRPLAFGHGRSG